MRITVRDLGIQANQLEQLLDALPNSLGGPVFDFRNEPYVLCDGEMREQTDFLNDIANHAAEPDDVPIGNGAAIDANFAGAGRKQVIDQLEGGSFAGAAAA